VIRNARVFWRTIALAALVTVSLCATAAANHSLKDQVTIGPAGGNGAVNAFFDGASTDGTRAIFETSESLVASDTDSIFDIYQRVGTTTTLLSTGPSGGNGPANDAFFDAISADGTRVFFDTDESLVSTDTDSGFDVYERSGSTTALVSVGSAGQNGSSDVIFDGISRDGAHVYFETADQFGAGDSDTETDIYDRSGGTTSLVTTGPTAGGAGGALPVFGGSSADGAHAFFETDEKLTSGDSDSQYDVYERSGASTALVSTGPAGGNGAVDAFYEGNSESGVRAFFSSTESLVSGDTDSQSDVYERSGGTTTLVSIGATGGNGAQGSFYDGSSADGGHVFFHTAESLEASDLDLKRDVYDRSGGATKHVSTGPNGGNGAIDAFFDGSSASGSHVWFETTESLLTADSDTRNDVYERLAGATTRVSTGTGGGNGAFDSFFAGGTPDGNRVFFTSAEALEATDTDASSDVYERFSGGTTHISTGPAGGNAAIAAFFDAVSVDGGRVFINTRESLLASDTDTARDVYVGGADGYARPRGATPIAASLVIAYQQCPSGTGNRQHGPPLAVLSCTPPAQASSELTVGTNDANGRIANAVGNVRYDAVVGNGSTPPNEADVKLAMSLTDVRKSSDLSDYAGELQVTATMRITDKNNAPGPGGGTESGTLSDLEFPGAVPCVATVSTTVGSTCSIGTTFNAIQPGSVLELKRSIWQVGAVRVFDGGPDGVASTSPNTLFATQGVFVP
jgi:hypothetical protein